MDKNIFSNFFIAHRGLHNEICPENSLSAFQNALKHNFSIELDVYILKDNSIVVHHDIDLNRSCGQNVIINTLTKNDLQNYHLFNTDEHIPLLQEVFDVVQGKVPILIEIKEFKHYKNLLNNLIPMINNYQQKYHGEIAVQSYNPFALRYCHKLNKQITLSYLCSKLDDYNKLPKIIKKMLYSLKLYKYSKASFVSVKKDEISTKIIKKSNNNIIPWVITSKIEQEKFEGNCRGIIFENFIPN